MIKVLDELPLGLIDEDEEMESGQIKTNRDYWIKRGSNETILLADKILSIINETGKIYELSYTKVSIKFSHGGQEIPFAMLKQLHLIMIKKNYKSV